MAVLIQVKGSLFDVAELGRVEVSEDAIPEVGDVIECGGKSYTITDVIRDEVEGVTNGASDEGELAPGLIAIVEPLAVSQRRGSRAPR